MSYIVKKPYVPQTQPIAQFRTFQDAVSSGGDLRMLRNSDQLYRKLGTARAPASLVKGTDIRGPAHLFGGDGVTELLVRVANNAAAGTVMVLYEHIYPLPRRYFWLPEIEFEASNGHEKTFRPL